jgi:hypothetical protein
LPNLPIHREQTHTRTTPPQCLQSRHLLRGHLRALLQAAGLILPLFGFSTAAVRIIFFILLGIFPFRMAFFLHH